MWMMMWDVLLLHRSVSSYLGKRLVVYNLLHFYYEIFLSGEWWWYLPFLSPVLCPSAHIADTHTPSSRMIPNGFGSYCLHCLNGKSFWTPFIDLVLFTTIDISLNKLFKLGNSINDHFVRVWFQTHFVISLDIDGTTHFVFKMGNGFFFREKLEQIFDSTPALTSIYATNAKQITIDSEELFMF